MQCVKKNVVSLIRNSDQEVNTATAWQLPDINDAAQAEPAEPELSEEEKALQQALEQGYQEGLQKGHAEGYQKGHQEGLEAGQNEGLQIAQQEAMQLKQQIQQHADQVLGAVAPLVEGLKHPLETHLDVTVNKAIATLVVQIARQVVKNELSVKPEHIVGVVNNLFDQLPMTEREVRLFLHPQDKSLIETAAPLAGSSFDWQLMEDDQIEPGGCRVESHNFSADESVENRLEQSVRKVFGEVDLDPPASTDALQGDQGDAEQPEPSEEVPAETAEGQTETVEGQPETPETDHTAESSLEGNEEPSEER